MKINSVTIGKLSFPVIIDFVLQIVHFFVSFINTPVMSSIFYAPYTVSLSNIEPIKLSKTLF